MKKHAYLIMAHNNFFVTHKLLLLLDDERNDIYLHIDAKAKFPPENSFSSAVKKANLYIIEKRLDVRWGMFSQIECELALFKCVAGKDYSRIHIIAGTTLPLKNQDEIHAFFADKEGQEFIDFYGEEFDKERIDYVRNLYWYMKKRQNIFDIFSKLINPISRFKHRKDALYKFRFGSQWCSITQELVDYLVSQRKLITRLFAHGFCCEEAFIQTLAFNSQRFSPAIQYDNLTAIDNNNGNPYIWRVKDIDSLLKSGKLFARKFSAEIDKEAVTRLYESVAKS